MLVDPSRACYNAGSGGALACDQERRPVDTLETEDPDMSEHNSNPGRITSGRLAQLRDALRYAAGYLRSAGHAGYADECRAAADLVSPAVGCRRRVVHLASRMYLFFPPPPRPLHESWTPNVDDAGEFPPIVAQWLAVAVGGEVEEVTP